MAYVLLVMLAAVLTGIGVGADAGADTDAVQQPAASPSSALPSSADGAPSAESLFATALIGAADDQARRALLDGQPSLVGLPLARVLFAEGRRLLREGALDRSLVAFHMTRVVADRAGDPKTNAAGAAGMAQTLSALGENDRALSLLRESEVMYAGLRDTTSLMQVLNNQAIVHRLRGDLDEALSLQRRLLAAREASGEPASLAVTLNNIGVIQRERGDYRDALVSFERSLGYKKPGTGEYASTVHNIGTVYHAQGDLAVARGYYARVLDGADIPAAQRMHSLAMLAEVTRRQGQLDAAAAYAEQATALAEQGGARPVLAGGLRILALINSDRGQRATARAQIERSVAVARSADDPPVLGYALATLGSELLHVRDFTRALAVAEEALALGDALEPFGQILAYGVAGEAQAALGHPVEARRAFEAAIERIETLRERIAGDAPERQQFFEGHVRPYHHLIALQLAQRQIEDALRSAERARARTLVDVVQRGHVSLARWLTADERQRERALDRRLGDLQRRQAGGASAAGPSPAGSSLAGQIAATRREMAALRAQLFAAHPELRLVRGEADMPPLADLGAAILDPSTIVLAYTVTPDRAWLFELTAPAAAAASSGGASPRIAPAPVLRVHALAVNVTTLAARVQRFREALATRNLDFVAEARALYGDLLGPAAEACKGKTRVILVPDGVLWDLPFQALQTPNRRFLIEEAAVTYAPSLTFLYERHAHARERTMPAGEPLELLALGNPTLTSAEATTFPPLPHAEDQVRRLAALYPSELGTTLVGAAAREARVKRDAGRYRILHFATHGVLDDGNALYSALLLAGDPGDADGTAEDGRLEARELMDIPLAADLVVLSACETARGRIGAGEGVLGLSWAILLAGSASTVVSQWKVGDESTSQLMVALHRHLRQTPGTRGAGDVAGALRGAALQVMRDTRYRHPFYWAGFRVVGAASSIGSE